MQVFSHFYQRQRQRPIKDRLLDAYNYMLASLLTIPMAVCNATWLGFFLLTQNYILFFISLTYLLLQSSILFKKDLTIDEELTEKWSDDIQHAQETSQALSFEQKLVFATLLLTCIPFLSYCFYLYFWMLRDTFSEQIWNIMTIFSPTSSASMLKVAAVTSQIAIIGFVLAFFIGLVKFCKKLAQGKPPCWFSWLIMFDDDATLERYEVKEGKINTVTMTGNSCPIFKKILHLLLVGTALILSLGFAKAYQNILIQLAYLWTLHHHHLIISHFASSSVSYCLMFGIMFISLESMCTVGEMIFSGLGKLINTFAHEWSKEKPQPWRLATNMFKACFNTNKIALFFIFSFSATLQFLSLGKFSDNASGTELFIASASITEATQSASDVHKVYFHKNSPTPDDHIAYTKK